MKTVTKVLFSLLAIFTVLCGGFIVWFIVAFLSGSVFYISLVFIFFTVVWLFLLAQIWNLPNPKIRYISTGVAIGVICVLIAGYELNKAYHNSFELMDERGVDLTLYDPFREDTLAASPDESPTLKLREDLPRLDGATALYPVYAGFVKAVYPVDFENEIYHEVESEAEAKADVDIVLTCSGTDAAYRRLIDGRTDIVFAAGPSEDIRYEAGYMGVELDLTPIGREAFVFFVNTQNPINGLAVSDILDIYSGKSTNWLDFGGRNATIRAYQRPDSSGSQTALKNFLGDFSLMTPPSENIVSGMGGMIQRVSSYRNYDNAIGYSFLYFTEEMVGDKKIKLLEIDGVAPTRENVANNTYPFTADFYAVTAGTKNPNAEAFIEWIISPQGQEIIEKTGYTPLD